MTALLVAIVLVLGPLIKRFGKSDAADVLRADPRTGKSYLAPMDVAYNLILSAVILMTTSFEPAQEWLWPGGLQAHLQHVVERIGGLLLLMGVLHPIAIVTLPVIGLVFSSGAPRTDSSGPSGDGIR